MTDKGKNGLAGAAAGLVNGLFGGGGGSVLLPLLNRWGTLAPRAGFATCLAAIYPMCCVSAVVYLFQVQPALETVLPYLAGGLAGGVAGGLTFQKVPVRLLKALFGAFLVYGGVRYLL